MKIPLTTYSISQNFLKRTVVEKVFATSVKIAPNLPIVDIGAGKGVISQWLLNKYTNRVIAFEIDPVLRVELQDTLKNTRLVIFQNFFERPIGEAYQVVSNIPFAQTTDILDRLIKDHFFQSGYIILQKEAADRFGGAQVEASSTLKSILLQNTHTLRVVHTFSPSDFEPAPQVTSVLIELKRKSVPTFMQKDLFLFENFVSYIFQHSHPNVRRSPGLGRYLARRINFSDIPMLQKSPSQITFDEYIKLFKTCERAVLYKLQDAMAELEESQENLQKVHRTRQAPDWKNKRY